MTERAYASDEVDSEPCPAIGNTLIIIKSGENAILNWQATECNDFAFYYVYAASSYNAPFPIGWTILSEDSAPAYSDSILSGYIGYKILAIDNCGNQSSY